MTDFSTILPLRAAEPQPILARFGPDRQRLAVFVIIAAWIHLLAFMLFSYLGFEPYGEISILDVPTERFVELVLEVNAPPEAPALPVNPALPEAQVSPVASDDLSQEAQAPPKPTEQAFPPIPPGAGLIDGEEIASNGRPPSSDGTINLEETAPTFKSYNTTVRSAVARHWILPPAARSDFRPGRFVAVMTLDRNGQVVVIVVEESSGISSLDHAAMEALRGAAPYPPFPPELAQYDQLNFRLHFDYRAVHRRPGTPPSER
ncbi:MAG: TonB family protein [Deltaproteobacteria bacterium]|nr:TonB family protein [Deltaproteobacteria bacterium]